MLTKDERIKRTEEQIREALKAYGAHISDTEDLDNVGDAFISRLAADAVEAKAGLREMLSKSPAWNEDMDALVINGNRTHDTDYDVVRKHMGNILKNVYMQADDETRKDILSVMDFFTTKNPAPESIDAINRIAKNAYAPGKKLSRVFKAICKALNIEENREFNQNYALLADELSAKKIDFKLFVSINPAHFITMSNPDNDLRGEMLTSCHSFNGGHTYKAGCTGYARDGVTMIAFTVHDPKNEESQYNRKTSRQLYMYKPGNGVLLQSRFYNSQAYGGTTGEQPESKLYRELIQKELSDAENAANLWNTCSYCDNKYGITLEEGEGFGGYADWPIAKFAAKISIRKDHADDYEAFSIGTYGLCVVCGDETTEGIYCDDCDNSHNCDECGDREHDDDLYTAYNADGDEVRVCQACLDYHYRYCECCEEYYHQDCATYIESEDRYVCDNCLRNDYTECDECGEYHNDDEMTEAYDEHGHRVNVCNHCLEDNYFYCEECDEYNHNDNANTAYKNGSEVCVCDDCLDDNYTECTECGEYHHNDDMDDEDRCPDCHQEEEC